MLLGDRHLATPHPPTVKARRDRMANFHPQQPCRRPLFGSQGGTLLPDKEAAGTRRFR